MTPPDPSAPEEAVLAQVPASIADRLRPLLEERPVPEAVLRSELRSYLGGVVRRAREQPLLDLPMARDLADRCGALLDGLAADAPELHRRLVQAALRYFILDDDVESDTGSMTGFDDDAIVVDVVARAVGREDLI